MWCLMTCDINGQRLALEGGVPLRRASVGELRYEAARLRSLGLMSDQVLVVASWEDSGCPHEFLVEKWCVHCGWAPERKVDVDTESDQGVTDRTRSVHDAFRKVVQSKEILQEELQKLYNIAFGRGHQASIDEYVALPVDTKEAAELDAVRGLLRAFLTNNPFQTMAVVLMNRALSVLDRAAHVERNRNELVGVIKRTSQEESDLHTELDSYIKKVGESDEELKGARAAAQEAYAVQDALRVQVSALKQEAVDSDQAREQDGLVLQRKCDEVGGLSQEICDLKKEVIDSKLAWKHAELALETRCDELDARRLEIRDLNHDLKAKHEELEGRVAARAPIQKAEIAALEVLRDRWKVVVENPTYPIQEFSKATLTALHQAVALAKGELGPEKAVEADYVFVAESGPDVVKMEERITALELLGFNNLDGRKP